MKKVGFKFIYIFLAVSVIVLFAFKGVKYHSGVSGYSGSPGDNNKNCSVCHHVGYTEVDNWIISDIPESGYVPNETYSFTAKTISQGAASFGFSLSSENSNNEKVGAFVVTDNINTQIKDSYWITNTSSGIYSDTDSIFWLFDWTAPAAGTGDITFYSSFLASNGNESTSGDITYTSTLNITENLSSSFNLDNKNAFIVYPTPSHGIINVKLNNSSKKHKNVISIYNNTGSLIKSVPVLNKITQINLTTFLSGIYFIKTNNKISRIIISK